MMISFKCKCGNCDPTRTKEYDGALGYEAVVCRTCGRYMDHNGEYEADDWSKQYIIPAKKLKLEGGWQMEWPELRKAGFGREAMGFEGHAAVYKINGVPAIAVSWMDGALAGFSVAKPFQGKGIGTRFIEDLLQEEKGTLRVIDPNERMVKLLGNLGRVSQPDGTGTVTLTKGGVMENSKEVSVLNTALMQSVIDKVEEKAEYQALMAKVTRELKAATDLTPGDKKKIAHELNQPCAAPVIRHWQKSSRDVIYAGVCMVNGGEPFLHEKFTRPGTYAKIPKEYTIKNINLMKEVEGLPDLMKKYQAVQEDLANRICYGQLAYSDKEKIVQQLNSPAGAELIAKHSEQPEITVYASLCAAEDGKAEVLKKYQLPEDVQRLAAVEGARTQERGRGGAEIEL